jgi:DNA segregation ATPase FtsK/SpoIIIE and related proteins
MFGDQSPALIEVYQASGVIAGMRGAGKTVLLQVITAMLARCTDCIIVHIDLNGGGMAGPWLTPYAMGRVGVPTVDWVARDAREALLVAQVLTAIAMDRKARYQRLRIEHNVDVLPVSKDIPEIVVIVDEGGEVYGEGASREAQQAARALRQLQAIGRAECVNVLLSTQRATATYIPSDVLVATALKVCGRVTKDSELAYLFDWQKGLRCADLTGAGNGFISRDQAPPRKFRWFHLLPAQIGDIAVATAPLRPTLDAAAGAVGGQVYAQRWERAKPWLDKLAGVASDEVATPPVAYVAPEPVMGAGEAGDLTAQVLASLRGDTAAATTGQRTPPAKEPELPEEWRTTAAQLAAIRTTEDPPEAADASDTTGRDFVLGLIREAGADGVRTGAIFTAASNAGLTVRRATVNRWCNELRTAKLIVKSAEYATWVATSQAAL